MEDSQRTYIKSFSLQGLWGYKNVEWPNVNSDVNEKIKKEYTPQQSN